MTRQTTTVNLRHDNTTAENKIKTTVETVMTILILILREDRAALDRTTERVVVGDF